MSSFWGKEKDLMAARQLDLSEDHVIFMMSVSMNYVDEDFLYEELKSIDGLFQSSEISQIVGRSPSVKLPKGYVLVGMVPDGKDEPRTYGLVKLDC